MLAAFRDYIDRLGYFLTQTILLLYIVDCNLRRVIFPSTLIIDAASQWWSGFSPKPELISKYYCYIFNVKFLG